MEIRPLMRVVAGFLLFCAGYLVINQQLLTEAILYRFAANDYHSSTIAFFVAAAQACILLLCVLVPGRLIFLVLMLLSAVSAVTNIIFVEILDEMLSTEKFAWLLTEARQARNAANEFAIPAMIGSFKAIIAIALIISSRIVIRPILLPYLNSRTFGSKVASGAVLTLAALPSLLYLAWERDPQMAERNIYSYAMMLSATPPAPSRPAVQIKPDTKFSVNKIVWIVDESIGYEVFHNELENEAAGLGFSSFGKVLSLSNCSAPANLAIRSGLPVPSLNNKTDIRKQPSIWRYARKAGYKTSLWDGQVTGAPQNMLFAPELALIDDYKSSAADIDTDRTLADAINRRLKEPGRDFIMAVMRGVHFQYSDHYPKDTLPKNSSLSRQYTTAVRYSKANFFAKLISGIDQDDVIIVYASDHGQHVKQGAMPHCSVKPDPAEFEIPLAVKMPDRMKSLYTKSSVGAYSASQIFPTTLQWMGYNQADIQKSYDAPFPADSTRRVWLGRSAFPVSTGRTIELHDFGVTVTE